MNHIVITGSTRGIGLGLAGAFLDLGCSVTVSGRSQAAVDEAVDQLGQRRDRERILGLACDVRDSDQVQKLWNSAASEFKRVDIWVNNAGLAGAADKTWEIPPEASSAVIETNVLGVIHGSRTAARGMLAQGAGKIFNMEGMGSDGRKHAGLALYGTSKYALTYFNDCLAQELAGTPVLVGMLRPGMVVTDLIAGQYRDRPQDWQRAKRVFNLLAERVEIVAPWLAGQMLATRENGKRIRYMTTGRLLGRTIGRLARKEDLFAG